MMAIIDDDRRDWYDDGRLLKPTSTDGGDNYWRYLLKRKLSGGWNELLCWNETANYSDVAGNVLIAMLAKCRVYW